MDVRPEQFFSEPDGWTGARIPLGSALTFFGIYAYFELRYGSGLPAALVIGVAMALSGVAEILPTDRRRSAIALRVAGIGVLVGLLLRSLGRVIA